MTDKDQERRTDGKEAVRVAARSEDLQAGLEWGRPDRSAEVLRFLTAVVRRRAARQRHIAVVRRRILVGFGAMALVLGILSAGGTGHSAPVSAEGAPKAVVLQQGETLWDLADRFAPPGIDKRAYVDALLERNELGSVPAAGAKVILPN